MSLIQDAIKLLDTASEAGAKEVKASLEMLDKLAEAKKQEMIRFTDDRVDHASERHEIPAGLKMFEASEVHVVSSKGPAGGISKALDDFMGNAEPRWKDGIKALIGSAIQVLLGAAEGASSNNAYYVIALDGKAATTANEETYVPVRLDYSVWVYNFKRSGLTETAESAIVFHARKSLLDYEFVLSDNQIGQSLTNIGVPKAMRDALIKQVNAEREKKRPHNIVPYMNNAPENIRRLLKEHFDLE